MNYPLLFIFRISGLYSIFFFFSSRRRHTRFKCDWSSDVCSSDLSDHLVGHGRLNHAWAHVVNANAPRSIFESRTLREPDDTVLSGMVGPAPGTAYKTSK